MLRHATLALALLAAPALAEPAPPASCAGLMAAHAAQESHEAIDGPEGYVRAPVEGFGQRYPGRSEFQFRNRIFLGGVWVDAWCDMTTAMNGRTGGWTLVWSNLSGVSGKLTTDMPWWRAIKSPPIYRWFVERGAIGGPPTEDLWLFEMFTGLDALIEIAEDRDGAGEMLYVWAPHPDAVAFPPLKAGCIFRLDPGDAYRIDFSGPSGQGCQILSGDTLPGFFTRQDGMAFTTVDRDNDIYEGGTERDPNCARDVSSGTPFWYRHCWDGSFFGGGERETRGYNNGAYWTGHAQSWSDTDTAPKGAGSGWLFVR